MQSKIEGFMSAYMRSNVPKIETVQEFHDLPLKNTKTTKLLWNFLKTHD